MKILAGSAAPDISGDTTTEEIVIEDDVSSSPISVPTKIYKYAFTNTSSTTSAIGLNSIPSASNVTVRYAYTTDANADPLSLTQLDSLDIASMEAGSGIYVYIILNVVDTTLPATYTANISWNYGKAGLMKYVVNGETTTEIIFKNALIEEPETPTVTNKNFMGWYSDSSYSTAVTFPFRSQGQILYAKFVDPYTVENTSDSGNYGFELNSSGYWESQNNGVNFSYSLCKVTFNLTASATVTFTVINYAESNYDFGIFSNLNTTLTASYTEDSSNVYKSFKGSSSASTQTLTYDIPTGTSYIYVKYRKDSSVSNYNDSLQFKVAITTTGGVT